MKAYTIIVGRPVGRIPVIFLNRPQDPAQDHPWAGTVEEWNTVEEAFKAVFEYCSLKEYRDEIRISSEWV